MGNHLFVEEPTGSMLTDKVRDFSDSVFLSGPGALEAFSASTVWKKKAEDVMRRESCKNRRDTAGQSIDIEWHVCLGDTSVHMLQKLQVLMSGTGHEPESFPERIVFARMFTDITNWESSKVQAECLGYWIFCGPSSENTQTYRKYNDHLTKLLTEDETISRFV